MFTVTDHETKNIIHTISQNFGINLSGMAMASLRLRISQFCRNRHLQSTNNIISRMLDDPNFFESFMLGISVGSPDMFRDPELWITLRDQILPDMVRKIKTPRIFIPGCVSGDELYSMAILLKESGLDKQIQLTATCRNKPIRKQIEYGLLSKGRYRNCQDNYLLFHPGSTLDKYLTVRDGRHFRKPGLLKQMKIKVQAEDHLNVSVPTNLILYRNRMIYFNSDTSRLVANRMLDQLSAGTIFIIGIKESAKHLGLKDRIDVVSSDLNIYLITA